MKTVIASFLGSILLFLLSGCATTAENPQMDKLGPKSGVELKGRFASDGYLMEDSLFEERMVNYPFKVIDLTGKTEPNGVRLIQATIQSNKPKTMDVQYRVDWFDEGGIAIDPYNQTWKSLELLSKSSRYIVATSPRPDAQSFVLNIRDIKFKKSL